MRVPARRPGAPEVRSPRVLLKNVTVKRRKMKIIVHELPPSNNKYLGNSHSFQAYRREKERWHWLIKAAIRDKPSKPLEKALVRITYCFPDRRKRDPDNYSGKFILDPLVREGILADDSFSHVELVLKACVDRENPRTEIEICTGEADG